MTIPGEECLVSRREGVEEVEEERGGRGERGEGRGKRDGADRMRDEEREEDDEG